MKVWVMQGSYEGEMFCSTHLTEKGAALAVIGDLLEFLDVESEETALGVMHDSYTYTTEENMAAATEKAIEWDQEKMKSMTREELWKIFGDWTEISWDRMSDRGYNLDVRPTEIQA